MKRVMVNVGLLLAFQVAASAAGARAVSEEDEAFVCRGAIASMMGHPIEIIEAERRGDMIWTSYVRPSDGKQWTNVCRLRGDQVEWAAVEDGSIGRWRTDNFDGEMTYVLDEAGVTFNIEFSDGSSDSGTFERD